MLIRLLIVLVISPLAIWSQKAEMPLKLWSSVGLRTHIAQHFNLDISRMYGFDTDPITLSFSQTSATLQFAPGRHLSLSGGWLVSTSTNREGFKISKQRFSAKMGWRNRIEYWRISNSLKIEIFDRFEKRYDQRIIYSFYIRPKTLKISSKIKWAPFLNMRLYYNLGGKEISQYNNEGDRIGRMAPEGLHRIRLKIGAYFKFSKKLKVTIQGMYQEEFNTVWSNRTNKNMHVRNPKTGNITRRFNNYYVLGISAKWYISPFKTRANKHQFDDNHDMDN